MPLMSKQEKCILNGVFFRHLVIWTTLPNYMKKYCLLCSATITILKETQLCWHNQPKHSSQYSQLMGKQQSGELEILNGIITVFLHKNKKWRWGYNQGSFLSGPLISQTKPLTDGELFHIFECSNPKKCV